MATARRAAHFLDNVFGDEDETHDELVERLSTYAACNVRIIQSMIKGANDFLAILKWNGTAGEGLKRLPTRPADYENAASFVATSCSEDGVNDGSKP